MKISDIVECSVGKQFNFIDFVKTCSLYKELLTHFEGSVVTDLINRYKKYGLRLELSSKQMIILNEIAVKLNSPFYFTPTEIDKVIRTEERPI